MGPRLIPLSLSLRVAFALCVVLAPVLEAKVVKVDCSKKSINTTLESNAEDLVIEFSGECKEDVLIERDRVTLRGTGTDPKITGQPGLPLADRQPGISVIGGDNVVLESFTVQDSDFRGILTRGASIIVSGLVVNGNRTGLLLSEGSSALIRNSDFNGNTGDGISAWDSSAVVFEGTINLNQNTRAGLLVSSSSVSVGLAGATVNANENDYVGYALQLGAQGLMSAAGPTSFTANDNFIGVTLSSESHWEGNAYVSGAEYCVDTSFTSTFAGGGAVSDCGFGFYSAQGSNMLIKNATASSAFYGIWVDGASVEVVGTAFTGGEEDVHLEFGARLSSRGGASATTVVCDGTELTRGPISCPPEPLSAGRKAILSDAFTRRPSRETREPLAPTE